MQQGGVGYKLFTPHSTVVIEKGIFTNIDGVIVGIHHGVLYGMWACAFGALVVSFLNYFHRCVNLKVSGVVGAIFGTIISCALTPVETYHADGVILAAINGLVGGLLANGLMFAQSDFKFERLAHEVTKVIGFAYSFTALSGGFIPLRNVSGIQRF